MLLSKGANLVIKPSEHGLGRFAFDRLMWVVGMKQKEALGGELHLTNYRLLFKTHGFNRLRGRISLFLPSLLEARDASFLFVRKIVVSTHLTRAEIVVWGIPELLNAMQRAAGALSPADFEAMRAHAAAHPERVGAGLRVNATLEDLNDLALAGESVVELLKAAANPLEAIGSLALAELLSRTVEEGWQRPFNR
ncbi:hypothetical protein MFUL124B02_24680 [Myxococcus fulvus 124B02]|nr:hypothetical protein MFUL124B02_24680 [Myxococcus fulvus 124B02]